MPIYANKRENDAAGISFSPKDAQPIVGQLLKRADQFFTRFNRRRNPPPLTELPY